MFDIVGRRRWWYALSALLVLPGVLMLATGGLKPGIDFTGGSLCRYVSPALLRNRPSAP